ncbi:MAG TPA: flagellar protein FlaG [Desulfobacterales bacterium]|nr:flagellar protein FlaG [Desulfobacterales bacterium]
MNIEALNTSTLSSKSSPAIDKINQAKNKLEKAPEELVSSESAKEIQPEELINQIKSLTENGVYSVRFESNEAQELVVKIVDSKTDEVIRQIPSEELIQLTKNLNELSGNMVDTVT